MTKKRALEQLSEVISFWNPDGCIIMGDAQHPYRNYAEFGKIPVVYCDAIPEELFAGSNAVSIDSEAVANCAARELLTMEWNPLPMSDILVVMVGAKPAKNVFVR